MQRFRAGNVYKETESAEKVEKQVKVLADIIAQVG
jgi:hypothetical protein